MDCAMLFPGQASQYVGMGRDYYDACEIVRETYEQANRALGFDIKALSFEGDLDELTKTHNAQPAILIHSIAVYRALVQKGVKPQVVAGHSLGEFSALVAAGYFEYLDALLIVRKRGELMYEAGLETPGTMAAIIGMTEDEVRGCVDDAAGTGVVVIANLNSPAQYAVSGEIAAVDKLVEIAKERGANKILTSCGVTSPKYASMPKARLTGKRFLNHGSVRNMILLSWRWSGKMGICRLCIATP